MSNLMDYLDWRGDLTFREAPFNEVDNLILAQLVYVEFAGIVPAPGEEGTITVKEACELFFAAHDRKEIRERVSMTKTAAFVLEKMAQTYADWQLVALDDGSTDDSLSVLKQLAGPWHQRGCHRCGVCEVR